ncbi:MAG: EI24 domain-containing protein [Burkholderiales bacterium]
MKLLLDSFWRAAAYCLHPRVIALSILPLLVMVALALGLGYFFWDSALLSVRAILDASALVGTLLSWLEGFGVRQLNAWLAPLLLIFAITPLLAIVSLLAVALLMTPALVALVAQRRFAALERKKGGSMLVGVLWSLASTLLALIALVLSIPLWFVPPLVLILPPLIWGWLTYRVMAFDALAEHASKAERVALFQRHRGPLLVIGVLSGYLGAAPSLLWASGVFFAAAFVVLVPVAIWIYTLVFAFSSLWFSHFCLQALADLRAEQIAAAMDAMPPAGPANTASAAALPGPRLPPLELLKPRPHDRSDIPPPPA